VTIYSFIVDPGGSGDYTSLSAWEAAQDIASDGYNSGDIVIADCLRTTSAKDATVLSITGWKAGVIPQIIVNESYRHEGKYADTRLEDGNYVYILAASSASPGVFFGNAGIVCDGLIIDHSRGLGGIALSVSQSCAIQNNIIRANNSASTILLSASNSGITVNAYNNIFIGNGVSNGYGYSDGSSTGAYLNLYNCTVCSCDTGINSNKSRVTAKNVIVSDSDTACFAGTFVSGTDNNVSSDATAPGTTVATSKTNYSTYFVDYANGDFHLKNTGYALFGVYGVDLSGTFTTDIDGDIRSAWDVGADEYMSGGSTLSPIFDGKIKIISASSILLDGLLKIKDDALNLLDGQVQILEQTSVTNLLDGELTVKDTATALVDGSLAIRDSAAVLLDGLVAVSNVGQDTLDGSVNINDDRITILDGELVLKSAGMNLFDGTVTVQNIALNYLDGKAQIKNTASDLLNGKITVPSNVTNSLDGKMLLESGGTVYDLLDGKISIKSITTDYLDGLISIQDYSTLSLDGKLIIFKNSALNLDGKVTVKDIASDLLDGKIAIKTNVVNLFDGNLSVKTASIGLLDGKIIIGDDGTTILDGKLVIASDSAINIFDGKIILTALAHGKVTITFDLKTPGITFDLKTPGITFSVV